MTASEAARLDLYNGLTDLLGPERAETLMTALPAYDTSELVTKSDLALLGADIRVEITELRVEIKSEISQLRAEIQSDLSEHSVETAGIGARVGRLEGSVAQLQEGQAAIHLRLDRLFLAMVGGLIVIVGVMAGIVLMP